MDKNKKKETTRKGRTSGKTFEFFLFDISNWRYPNWWLLAFWLFAPHFTSKTSLSLSIMSTPTAVPIDFSPSQGTLISIFLFPSVLQI